MTLFEMRDVKSAVVVDTAKIAPVVSKAEMSVKQSFPTLENGKDYPFCTGADWSTHDLIMHIIDLIGPCEMVAATWSVSDVAAQKIIAAMNDGRITKVFFLVDWRVQVRSAGFMPIAKSRFADVRVSSCHAKAFVLTNDQYSISVVGSANFTNNPRIEAGHLSTNKETADFHRQWMLAEIKNAAPFGIDMRKRGNKDGRK